MNWIKFLDNQYRQLKHSNKNISNNYFFYPKNNIKPVSVDIDIIILKQFKTKILIEDCHNRKLNLTDKDIIKVLIDLDETVFNIIINSIENLFYTRKYRNYELVIFDLKDQEYKFNIPSLFFDSSEHSIVSNTTVHIKGDIKVNLIDILTIISFIIDKEHIASSNTKDVAQNYKRAQIAKFVHLSKFYREEKDDDSKLLLESIGYPIEKKTIDDVYNKDIKIIDRMFRKRKWLELS